MISTPKGDWNFVQSETGMKFKEVHPKALEAAVFNHRMSLPDLQLDCSGGWQARLWDEICRTQEHLDCVDCDNPGRFPNISDVWSWVKSMLNWRNAGYGIVPQEEAERRAAICVTCPHNKIVSGCFGCHGVGEVISDLIGGKKTSQDQKLHQCSACHGCMLGPKVFMPLQVLNTDAYKDRLPSFCWLK